MASPLILDFAIITGLEQRIEVSTDGGKTFELEERSSGARQETAGLSSTRELARLFCADEPLRCFVCGVLGSLSSLLSARAARAASPLAATMADIERSAQMTRELVQVAGSAVTRRRSLSEWVWLLAARS